MTFDQLGLNQSILKALAETGYETPTPIQARAIPPALKGQDLLACAQTGTGKTAAFCLPILDHLAQQNPSRGPRPIRALILTPTRELAIQIGESLDEYAKYLKLFHTVIFGGVSQRPQEQALKRGIDMLVATPGRLLDLIGQGVVKVDELQFFVLDEADRMLDMGFVHDVRRVLKVIPKQRQSLFFSATMPPAIIGLANGILTKPARVEVTPPATTVEKIDQSVYYVEKRQKRHLLTHLLTSEDIDTALVFTRTKHGANKVAQGLTKAGIQAEAIHGNKSQNARQQALSNFKSRRTRVLVATDIASRGIDVDALSHVINYDLPNEPETYVHRIGRTGRAGESGIAMSFCDVEEKEYLRGIVKLIKHQIPVIDDHPYPMNEEEVLAARREAMANQPNRGRGGRGGGGGRRRNNRRR